MALEGFDAEKEGINLIIESLLVRLPVNKAILIWARCQNSLSSSVKHVVTRQTRRR
jgi:hypothetical protein